jgi:hypothetical protein
MAKKNYWGGELFLLPSSEQNDEECDARDDHLC